MKSISFSLVAFLILTQNGQAAPQTPYQVDFGLRIADEDTEYGTVDLGENDWTIMPMDHGVIHLKAQKQKNGNLRLLAKVYNKKQKLVSRPSIVSFPGEFSSLTQTGDAGEHQLTFEAISHSN